MLLGRGRLYFVQWPQRAYDLCPQSVADLTIKGGVRSGLLCKDKFRSFITRGNLKYEDNAIVKTQVMGWSAGRDLSRWL